MKSRWMLLALLASTQAYGATKWIGIWAASPQPAIPGAVRSFHNQTVRLIVHTTAAGSRLRIRISNLYGDHPLRIGAAHIARRTNAAAIDPDSDRALKFHGQPSVTVPAGSMIVSDPVDETVPALSDLAISIFFPEGTEAKTTHVLAKQTNYVSPETGDSTASATFAVDKTFRSWPFLIGVDTESSSHAAATIVAFGSSLTDGDGSTSDRNQRFPDILAERLQKAGHAELSVLNEGIIGNRLLSDRLPPQFVQEFGGALGEAGLTRFDRDVLAQPGVKYVIMGLGINDIAFPGSFTAQSEFVTAESLIAGYRQIIKRAHRKAIRVIGTTLSPFENSFFKDPPMTFFTPEKEAVRVKVNDWILNSKEFDGVVDIAAAVRDPNHPTQILAAYDSGDHLHPNDAGYVAQANLIPLELFTPHWPD